MEQNYYNEIINYLMNSTIGPGSTDQEKAAIVKRSSKYKVVGGVLYHKGKGRGIDDLRLVLTDPVDQENAIRSCHINETTGRHFGRNKTASLLASKYYWRMMYTDVMHHVAECSSCYLNRELLERKSMQDRTKVWKLVEVEFLENFHTTRHYTFHLLKMVDVFSKWTRCMAVHNNSERNIVGTLLEQFGSFGFPAAVRFVNCKAVAATLTALQKELELFVKRAGDVLPILGEVGVDVDGINTCFKDLTVHVAVEEGENVLCDFDSFEDYLRAFQFSRSQEEASSPVFHVLFGQQSVVEEPIRNWLMDKICHLKKQNAYNWASQMPFYMFCLQNCVPPTMTQSPFSIMFNRCPKEEPLWCWYDKTQYLHVYDDSSSNCKEMAANKKVPQKKEVHSVLPQKKEVLQSVLKKKEPQKRHQFDEPDWQSEKKVRLDLDKKIGLDRSSLLRKSAANNSLVNRHSSSQQKTIKDSPLFADKLNAADLITQTRRKSYLYKSKDGTYIQKPLEDTMPLNQSKQDSSSVNRSIKDTSISTLNKSAKESIPLNKSTKENLASNKLAKDNLHSTKTTKDSSRTSKSCKDKKSLKKSVKDNLSLKDSSSTKDSAKDNELSTKNVSLRTPAKDIIVPVVKDSSLSPVKCNKDISPSPKDLKNSREEILQPSIASLEEGQILRSLCMEQSQSTLKKRFPGRPYKKKTRKYVDMATEVPVHRPHELSTPTAPLVKVPRKDSPVGELPLSPTPKPPSKPRVNGEETPTHPSRYSFRQNLKPRGPSSYVQRFIAISSSKRTTSNESEIELTPSNDGGLVDDPKFPPIAEEVELVACDLIQEILDSPTEIVVVPPLTNGDCEEDTMPYESELCVDDSLDISKDFDLDVLQEENDIPVSADALLDESFSTKDADLPVVAPVSKDDSVSKETCILGETATRKDEIETLSTAKELNANVMTSKELNADAMTSKELNADVMTSKESNADVMTSKESNDDAMTSNESTADAMTSNELTADVMKSKESNVDAMMSNLSSTDTLTLSKKTQESNESPKTEGVVNLVPPANGDSSGGSSVNRHENNLDSLPCSKDSFGMDKHNLKPSRVTLSRLSSFVTQRALEGTVQLRRVTLADQCSLFMGDLKIAEYSPVVQKKTVVISPSNSMCKRVIQRRKYVEKPFRCPLCPKTFLESEEELSLHMRFHDDGVEGLFCPVCKRSGQSWRLIFRHFFTHKEAMGDANVTCVKYRKVCTQCRKVFATEDRFQKHMRVTHSTKGDQQFKCSECDLTFMDPKALGRHQQIHSDITYQCGECGYSTKTHYNYILHTKFHESQRLDLAAKEGNSAKIMDVMMDENGMFSCVQCNYKTLLDTDLIRHIQLRHGTKKSTTFYPCDQCGKKFRSQVQLCTHVLSSHKPSNNMFICKLCPYKAKYKSVIHKHAKKYHPNFALKDVVQRPKIILKPGRPRKSDVQQAAIALEEEVHNPEDDIPTATVVVHTDENGELMVCDEEDVVETPQIICVDSEGNFVLEEGGQTLQIVGGEDQMLYGGQDQVLLVSMEPGNS